MPDFGNGQTAIYDAYADVKISPYVILRGGKFKTPLGLEQLENDADLTFIERSLATDLVQNRDEGLQFYGHVRQRFTYQFALDNGAPIGAPVSRFLHRAERTWSSVSFSLLLLLPATNF